MMRKTRKQNLKQFKTMKISIYNSSSYVEILIDSIFSYHQANIYLYIYIFTYSRRFSESPGVYIPHPGQSRVTRLLALKLTEGNWTCPRNVINKNILFQVGLSPQFMSQEQAISQEKVFMF